MNRVSRYFFISAACIVLFSCSTEKNTSLNRFYHGMTAKYNGHFNANELLTQSLFTFTSARKDDFYTLLPIAPLPNETEVKGMFPAIDTAIVKCSKVIKNHSMPSTEDMSTKEAEHNKWIDENWITVGEALFYRRDYDKSLKNFQFVKRFFQNDPSRYIAEMWIAKIYIQQNKYSEAKLILESLQETALSQKKKKFIDFVPFAHAKEKKSPDAPPIMSKSLQFEIFKAQAELAAKRKQYDDAAFSLSNAIPKCPNKQERARLHFILAQIYQLKGEVDSADFHYVKAYTAAAAYEVAFNARLNRAMLGNNVKLLKGLDKMLRDSKNAPYKDQIYYAKAVVELNRGNNPMAKSHLTNSAFYSTSNKRQKALSYEKLGDISFAERNYLPAQKYYDSCAKFMPEDYPNGDLVKSKANKLADLVKAIETAQFEDSVQRIAKMPEKEQTAFLKDLIKDIKKQEQRRKEQEAAKLLALQENNAPVGNVSGNKWYWNNTKLIQEGVNEFKKLWGVRENEDDWRRSDKIIVSFDKEQTQDSTLVSEEKSEEKDTLSIESLRKNLPLTDTLMEASILREIDALYNSGLLYKELLNENSLAATQFEKVMEKNRIGLTDLSSAFQLYTINEGTALSKQYKDYIVKHYPNSDMANFFKDPDFFKKQKEGRIAAQKDYLALVKKYEAKEYTVVFNASQNVVDHDKSNALRAEYLLLNVLVAGQLTEDKQSLLPRLNNIIDEKPSSDQAKRAQELIDILKKGYSINLALPTPKTSVFNYNDTVTQFVIILLDEEEEVGDARNAISDFTTKQYKVAKLKVASRMTLTEVPFVIVTEFNSIKLATDYINAYKASYQFLNDWQNNRIQIITQENLKKLIESSNFDAYKEFYDLNY